MKVVGNNWDNILKDEYNKDYFKKLIIFIKNEYKTQKVYPKTSDIFNALKYTDYNQVKVVILGQDPYHNEGEAHGLAFSVQDNIKIPPSLVNIFKELRNDLGISKNRGNLEGWAKQGVLLLNAVLTVQKNKPNSHQNKGWEVFTDRIIELLNEKDEAVVFLLWGNNAKSKKPLIKNKKHLILESSHPSPFSYYHSFKDSKPFSKTNDFLKKNNKQIINW